MLPCGLWAETNGKIHAPADIARRPSAKSDMMHTQLGCRSTDTQLRSYTFMAAIATVCYIMCTSYIAQCVHSSVAG